MRISPLRLALLASLALNLFLGAVLAAPLLFPPQPRERDAGRFAARIEERLPEGDRAIFRQAYASHEPALREGFARRSEARQKARAALSAEPFDDRALEAALAEWRASSEAMQAAMQAAILDAAPRLSPEGRSSLLPSRKRR